MDIETVSGLALFCIGTIVLVGFRAVERYDSARLTKLLMAPPEPSWAAWLISVSAALFAQETALGVMGHIAERRLTASAANREAPAERGLGTTVSSEGTSVSRLYDDGSLRLK